jgi:hypothetical protein
MEDKEITEFLIEIINKANGQSAVFSTEQVSFPEAMADDWKIVSVLDKTHFVTSNRRLP